MIKTHWRKQDGLPGAGMQMWQAKRKSKSYANAKCSQCPHSPSAAWGWLCQTFDSSRHGSRDFIRLWRDTNGCSVSPAYYGLHGFSQTNLESLTQHKTFLLDWTRKTGHLKRHHCPKTAPLFEDSHRLPLTSISLQILGLERMQGVSIGCCLHFSYSCCEKYPGQNKSNLREKGLIYTDRWRGI